jgi:hypothetical protein
VKSLERITWNEWFRKFDAQQLAFLYQTGKNTNFNKLVRREPERARASNRRRGASRTARGGRARRAGSGSRRAPARGRSPRQDGDLEQLTRAELYERARDLEIANRARMSKPELVRAVSRAAH